MTTPHHLYYILQGHKMGVVRVIWETLTNFGRETSIAGLNNASKASGLIRKTCWGIIFSVLVYFTIKGLVGVIVDFNKHPIVTTVSLEYKSSVPFPAVTVCNQNRSCAQLRKYPISDTFTATSIPTTESTVPVFC